VTFVPQYKTGGREMTMLLLALLNVAVSVVLYLIATR